MPWNCHVVIFCSARAFNPLSLRPKVKGFHILARLCHMNAIIIKTRDISRRFDQPCSVCMSRGRKTSPRGFGPVFRLFVWAALRDPPSSIFRRNPAVVVSRPPSRRWRRPGRRSAAPVVAFPVAHHAQCGRNAISGGFNWVPGRAKGDIFKTMAGYQITVRHGAAIKAAPRCYNDVSNLFIQL